MAYENAVKCASCQLGESDVTRLYAQGKTAKPIKSFTVEWYDNHAVYGPRIEFDDGGVVETRAKATANMWGLIDSILS